MSNELKKQFPATLLMLIILLLGAWYLFADSMNSFPAYVHSWTQTDRLAIALNFQENGFDFFHPATYNLLTKDGVTQVDFPIHDYLVACISNITHTDIVQVFRGYNLIYSLIGLFFFFRLALVLTNSASRSIFATLFLFTLPFFVYYQNGLLPSVPSYANFCIGLFYLVKYQRNRKLNNHLLAVVFLCLAALARAPFLIFLIAYGTVQLWYQVRDKKHKFIELLLPLIGVLIFISYFFYNKYLAETYGSMFLVKFLSFSSFQDFINTLSIALDRWGNQLLSPFHAIFLVLLLAIVIIQLSKRKKIQSQSNFLMHFLIISALGILLFFFAFGKQFAEHDYYYIDSFLPLLSIVLLIAFSILEIPRKWYTISATLCGIFFFYFFTFAKTSLEKRYTPPYNDRIEYAYKVYKNAKSDFVRWEITKKDTLLVLDANTTNMPFTIWGNRGYTSLNSAQKKVKGELDSAFSYAVLLDSFFISSSFKAYPNIIKKLSLVQSNNELSIYKKSKSNDPNDFFKNLILYAYSDFDNLSNFADSNTAWTSKFILHEEKGNSLKIEAKNEYTLTWKLNLENLDQNKAIEVLLLGDYYSQDSTKIQIITGLNKYYSPKYLENELTVLNQWKRQQYHFKIDPKYFEAQNNVLNFYFWNPHKNELYVDNVTLLIYQ